MKNPEFDEALRVIHQQKSSQFVVRIGDQEFVISDTINLSENVISVTVNGQKHTLQLVSRNSVGKIDLQYLGSVFSFNVYTEDVFRYLHLMPEKKVADTSRQV